MNKYRILTFIYGNTQAHIVEGYDIVRAIQNNGINMIEVIKVELIDSSDEIDHTA